VCRFIFFLIIATQTVEVGMNCYFLLMYT
jgi:CRISPR/Cas system-associated endonuclease/helicase Cas3